MKLNDQFSMWNSVWFGRLRQQIDWFAFNVCARFFWFSLFLLFLGLQFSSPNAVHCNDINMQFPNKLKIDTQFYRTIHLLVRCHFFFLPIVFYSGSVQNNCLYTVQIKSYNLILNDLCFHGTNFGNHVLMVLSLCNSKYKW